MSFSNNHKFASRVSIALCYAVWSTHASPLSEFSAFFAWADTLLSGVGGWLHLIREINFKSETDMIVPSPWMDSHNLGHERSQLSFLVITLKNLAIIVVFPVNTVLGVANFVSFDILCSLVGSISHFDGLDGLGLNQIDLDPLLLVTYLCTPCFGTVWGIIHSWICMIPIPNWWKGNWVTFFQCLLNPIRVSVWLLIQICGSFQSLDGIH